VSGGAGWRRSRRWRVRLIWTAVVIAWFALLCTLPPMAMLLLLSYSVIAVALVMVLLFLWLSLSHRAGVR
jgi:hypothetical protein